MIIFCAGAVVHTWSFRCVALLYVLSVVDSWSKPWSEWHNEDAM